MVRRLYSTPINDWPAKNSHPTLWSGQSCIHIDLDERYEFNLCLPWETSQILLPVRVTLLLLKVCKTIKRSHSNKHIYKEEWDYDCSQHRYSFILLFSLSSRLSRSVSHSLSFDDIVVFNSLSFCCKSFVSASFDSAMRCMLFSISSYILKDQGNSYVAIQNLGDTVQPDLIATEMLAFP